MTKHRMSSTEAETTPKMAPNLGSTITNQRKTPVSQLDSFTQTELGGSIRPADFPCELCNQAFLQKRMRIWILIVWIGYISGRPAYREAPNIAGRETRGLDLTLELQTAQGGPLLMNLLPCQPSKEMVQPETWWRAPRCWD